jgi:hypothetical protein
LKKDKEFIIPYFKNKLKMELYLLSCFVSKVLYII